MLADALKTLLQGKGFEVECVYDGEDGEEYVELGVYDLLKKVIEKIIHTEQWENNIRRIIQKLEKQ